MQTYPSQPYLSRGTHLFIKTFPIELLHVENLSGILQPPFKHNFPTFHFKTSSFSFITIEPSKLTPEDKQDFIRSWEASSNIIFLFQIKFLPPPHPLTWIPYPHPKGTTCYFNRPLCFSLNEIRASIEWYIKNFFFKRPSYISIFKPPNYNPPKRYM